jgi:peptidyl-prolyl cis-trans isomerase SurA
MRLSLGLLFLVSLFLCVSIDAEKSRKVQRTVSKDNEQVKQTEQGELYLLDTIQAAIFGEEGTEIITKSELERPGIDGVYRSLQDLIMERLLYQEAKKYKMLPTQEAVEKHLRAVQQEHNLTLDDLYEIFRVAGYSPEEGKEQFARLSAISSVIDFKIRSRLIVPEKDIIAYCEEYPVWEDSAYRVQRSIVPIPKKKDTKKFKKELEQFFKTGIGTIAISWSDPFWVNQPDLGQEWQFIIDMKVDSLKIVQELPEGFELLKLVEKKEKRLKPLEERYREVADILRRPKFEELFAEYKNNLLNNASIVYFEE